MYGIQFLHNLMKKSCSKIDAKRLNVLFTVITGLIFGRKLSVSGLGRALIGRSKVKNKIKLVDRLVGNTKFLNVVITLFVFELF